MLALLKKLFVILPYISGFHLLLSSPQEKQSSLLHPQNTKNLKEGHFPREIMWDSSISAINYHRIQQMETVLKKDDKKKCKNALMVTVTTIQSTRKHIFN